MSREQELEALLHWHEEVERDYRASISRAYTSAAEWEAKAARLEHENKALAWRMAEGFPVQWEMVSEWEDIDFHACWQEGRIQISLPDGHYAIFRRIEEGK